MNVKEHFACKFAKTEFRTISSFDGKDSDYHRLTLYSDGHVAAFLSRNLSLVWPPSRRYSLQGNKWIFSFSGCDIGCGKFDSFLYSLVDPKMNAATILWVFVGSGLGGVVRFLISWFFKQNLPNTFPWGTLVINILACALAGWVVSKNFQTSFQEVPLTVILLVGFCGGFSTFSTFGLETWQLISKGSMIAAVVYVMSSVVLGVLAFALAMRPN